MGIQGLVGFLGKRAPKSIRPWTGNVTRVRVAVDATLYLCRFFYANREIVTPAQLAKAYDDFHTSLLWKKFDPIHVFDGETSALKRFAHEKRAKARESGVRRLADLRQQAESMLVVSSQPKISLQSNDSLNAEDSMASINTIETLNDHDLGALLDSVERPASFRESSSAAELADAELAGLLDSVESILPSPLEQQAGRVATQLRAKIESLEAHYERGMSRDFLRAAVELLSHLDIQVAPDEAEQMCAQLASHGFVDMVMTEDIDALVFGAPLCLRGITTMTPTVVCLRDILSELSLTPEAFVDFCVLCGSDFTPKAPGFGPVKSLAFVKQHGSMDSLVSHLPAKWPADLWSEFALTAPLARDKFLSSWGQSSSSTQGAPCVAHVQEPVNVQEEKH